MMNGCIKIMAVVYLMLSDMATAFNLVKLPIKPTKYETSENIIKSGRGAGMYGKGYA